MSRNKATGEKSTSTKPERKHNRAVDNAIANPSPANNARTDKTFAKLHSSSTRYNNRH
jgi:hypothetical protein